MDQFNEALLATLGVRRGSDARPPGRTVTVVYRGHFHHLVPEGMVVEVLEFESDDPALAGEMTMTTSSAPPRTADAGPRADRPRLHVTSAEA